MSQALPTTQSKYTFTKDTSEYSNNYHQHHNISALAAQLQELQIENSHQLSEIAHLKRQLKLLSEFKGFDLKGKELWEQQQQGGSGRSFITVLSSIEGAMNNNRNYQHAMPSSSTVDNSGDNNDGIDLSASDNKLQLNTPNSGNNKYKDDDEAQSLEAIAYLSPKVSELLKEEALHLDDVLDTSTWSDSSSDDGFGKKKRRRKRGGAHDDDDEDGMNEEWNQLEAAGLSLQEELALAANGFDNLYGSDHYDGDDYNDDAYDKNEARGPTHANSTESATNQYYKGNDYKGNTESNSTTNSITDTIDSTTPQQLLSKLKLSYSLADHAVTLDVKRKVSDRGLYTRPLLSRNEIETLGVVTLPNWIARPGEEDDTSIDNTSRGREMYMNRVLSCTTEYIEPPKSKTLRKLFSGWMPGPGERRSEDEVADRRGGMDGDDNNKLVTAYSPFSSTTNCHRDSSLERIGGEMTKRQGGHLRAIVPGRRMRVWMPGEWEREQSRVEEEDEYHDSEGEAIRNKSSTTFDSNDDSDAHSVVSMLTAMSFTSPIKSPKPKGPTFKVLPPYLVDAQLVTKKLGKECERLLLIRIYRVQDIAQQSLGADDQEELLDVPPPLDCTTNLDVMGDGRRIDLELESKRSVSSLQDAASLVQRLKAVGGDGFAIDQPQPMLAPLEEHDDESVSTQASTMSYLKSFGDAITSPIKYFGGSSVAPLLTSSPNRQKSNGNTVMGLMTNEIRRKCQASPSVGAYSKTDKSRGLYPCLSKDDAPYVQSSWIFLKDCILELDRRCLGYSTLGVSRLFESPSLPQIDVHYIAQIKAFCRESMIVSLVKTASELEVYAREQEVACSNLDHLLRPTFEAYKLAPPPLPKPVPLSAYPLDFQPPEEMCPPWGPDVMNTLEKISNEQKQDENGSSNAHVSSFEQSAQAISRLVAAFQRQHDVEQGSRLGRKNMQVMDRLAKMQAHKRNSILKIRDSYGSNLLATNAADEYHCMRQKSSNAGSLSDTLHAVPDQVPLLICNVLVGNAAGTCYITSSHVLFHTQLVPIIGGDKVHLFSISEVELTINPPSKSMLSPLPASISLTTSVSRSKATREEVYHFIPSIGARRFAKFIEVVRDVLLDDPNKLKLTERGGLIYMYDEPKDV
ncbi:hypothetical protein ACHAWC_008998 [Mediolabrus comicus]